MAIVYDVEISVKVKTDDLDNPLSREVTITLPNSTYERVSSIWPEVLYQANMSRKLLERKLAEGSQAVEGEIPDEEKDKKKRR